MAKYGRNHRVYSPGIELVQSAPRKHTPDSRDSRIPSDQQLATAPNLGAAATALAYTVLDDVQPETDLGLVESHSKANVCRDRGVDEWTEDLGGYELHATVGRTISNIDGWPRGNCLPGSLRKELPDMVRRGVRARGCSGYCPGCGNSIYASICAKEPDVVSSPTIEQSAEDLGQA